MLLVLSVALLIAQAPAPPLTLEIRVFAGVEDVTNQTRVTLHKAGERGQPLGQVAAVEPRVLFTVPPDLYDVQAVRERDGRVLGLRWAERLIVMPYPDEGGHHLEVINLLPGFGALQVRAPAGLGGLELALSVDGKLIPARRGRHAKTPDYSLFVVPAGPYDLLVRDGSREEWHRGIDVPLDRTRLWIVP